MEAARQVRCPLKHWDNWDRNDADLTSRRLVSPPTREKARKASSIAFMPLPGTQSWPSSGASLLWSPSLGH